jgi:hypothetical protein
MGTVIDISGNIFGRLTAIRRTGRSKGRASLWECKCSCGNIKIIQSDSLRSGRTKSCGCLTIDTNRRLNSLPLGEAIIRRKLRTYRQSANHKGYVWGLNEITTRKLLISECFYCGLSPAMGIDRVNNFKGYLVDNTRSCCKVCNYAKNTMSEIEFFAWVRRVYSRL